MPANLLLGLGKPAGFSCKELLLASNASIGGGSFLSKGDVV
jgi:hypothetical protein